MRRMALRLTQMLWFALLIFVIYILLMRMHAKLSESHAPCVQPHCRSGQITPDQARLLHRLGLPLNLYNLYDAALGVLFEATFIAVAALIIWRRRSDVMALFTAFTLLLFGGIAGSADPKVPPGVPEPFSFLGNVLATLGTAALFLFFYFFQTADPSAAG